MPRFLQPLPKQYQNRIVILHESTNIVRNTKMSDNDPKKGECGVCPVETLGMGKTCKAPRKTNKKIGRSVITMKLEDTKEEEVKRGSGNTKGLIQALRQSFQTYCSVTIQEKARRCQDSDEKEEEFKSGQKTQAHIVEKQEEKATQ